MNERIIKVRCNWVDWVKAIGIWLVILGHGNLVGAEWRQLIYSFHMPLFFVLSGCLFRVLPAKERLKKDFHTLIVPYLCINGVCFLLWFAGGYLIKPEYHRSLEPLVQRLGAIFLGLGYDTDFWIAVCTSSWFLIALFIVRCITNFTPPNLHILLCMMILGLGFVFKHWDVRFYFAVNSVVMALPFFVVGMWMKKRLLPIPCLWLFGSFGILWLVNHYNGRVDMATFNYGRNMLLYYAGGFAGTFFIFAVAQLLNRYSNRFVRTISEGTILIIGFNLLAIEVVVKCFGIFGVSPEQHGVIGVAISVIILVLFYPGILVSGKYFPYFIGKQNRF